MVAVLTIRRRTLLGAIFTAWLSCVAGAVWRCRRDEAAGNRCLDTGCPEGHVERLHASADGQQRKICSPGQLCHFQLEGGTPLAHNASLHRWRSPYNSGADQGQLPVSRRPSMWVTKRRQGAEICDERKDDRYRPGLQSHGYSGRAESAGSRPPHSFRSPALKSGVTPMSGFIVQ